MSADDSDYKVGYKKPPAGTRFRPGVSGNRKGRPKGVRNLKADLQEELAERVTLKEDGRSIGISKQRALVKALVVRGIRGDDRAIAKAFDLLLRLIGNDEQPDQIMALSEEDQSILAAFLARHRGGHGD